MKPYLYMLLLLILGIVKNINPQEINSLDFFPHNIGDLWQYVTYTQSSSEFTQVEVISVDTILTDSSITITKNNGYQDFHFKIFLNDSLKIYQETLGGWGILYDLDAPINSFWISDPYFPYYTKYVDEYAAEVFNDSLLAREYWVEGDTVFNLSLWTEHLALGIGEFYGEFEIGITVLTGCIINGIQYGIIVNVEEQNESLQPQNLQLSNNPNPFNSQTTINYYLPISSYISLSIFDILGRKIKEIFRDEELSGYHTKIWIPQNNSSGIYLVVLRAEKTQLINKIIYLK